MLSYSVTSVTPTRNFHVFITAIPVQTCLIPNACTRGDPFGTTRAAIGLSIRVILDRDPRRDGSRSANRMWIQWFGYCSSCLARYRERWPAAGERLEHPALCCRYNRAWLSRAAPARPSRSSPIKTATSPSPLPTSAPPQLRKSTWLLAEATRSSPPAPATQLLSSPPCLALAVASLPRIRSPSMRSPPLAQSGLSPPS